MPSGREGVQNERPNRATSAQQNKKNKKMRKRGIASGNLRQRKTLGGKFATPLELRTICCQQRQGVDCHVCVGQARTTTGKPWILAFQNDDTSLLHAIHARFPPLRLRADLVFGCCKICVGGGKSARNPA